MSLGCIYLGQIGVCHKCIELATPLVVPTVLSVIIMFAVDMPVACIDTGACNFSNLPLINITEIMSISLATVES